MVKASNGAGEPTSDPVLVCLLGRPRTGKSVAGMGLLYTWPAGRKVKALDFDPAAPRKDSRTLSWFCPGVESPGVLDDPSRLEWLKAKTAAQIKARGTPEQHDLIVDFGGDEDLLTQFSSEFQFVEMMKKFGIRVVALYAIGPNVADLRPLREAKESKVFKPEVTGLILNEALVGAKQTLAAAFSQVAADELVKGLPTGTLPALGSFAQIEEFVGKHEAIALPELAGVADERFGLWDACALKFWLDDGVAKLRTDLSACLP